MMFAKTSQFLSSEINFYQIWAFQELNETGICS